MDPLGDSLDIYNVAFTEGSICTHYASTLLLVFLKRTRQRGMLPPPPPCYPFGLPEPSQSDRHRFSAAESVWPFCCSYWSPITIWLVNTVFRSDTMLIGSKGEIENVDLGACHACGGNFTVR